MNIGRRKDSSSSPFNHAKAVLKEARLLRLSSISPRSSYYRDESTNKKVLLKERSSESASFCSESSSKKRMNLFPPFSFAKIKDKKNIVPHDLPNEIGDIVQELKQIKQNIVKDMKKTKEVDIDLNLRIQSFMEACNLVLNQFDKQSEYEIDGYSKEIRHHQKNDVEDNDRDKSMPRRKSSLRTNFQKQRSLSSVSANSSVRFDLSQNEIFG